MTNYRIHLHSPNLTAYKGVQARTLLCISNLGTLTAVHWHLARAVALPRAAAPILSCSATSLGRTALRHCRNSCTVGRTYLVFGVYHAPWQLWLVSGRFLHLPDRDRGGAAALFVQQHRDTVSTSSSTLADDVMTLLPDAGNYATFEKTAAERLRNARSRIEAQEAHRKHVQVTL